MISNGGRTIAYWGCLGDWASSSNNAVLVADPGSLWTNNSEIWVGWSGAGNAFVISNGAHVVSRYGSVGIDYSSSNNSVLVTGAGSIWSNSDRLVIGYGGGNNTLVIENGGAVELTNILYIGYEPGSVSNVVELDDGTVTVTNKAHNAKLDVWGGTLTVNGGTCTVDTLLLTNGPDSVLAYNGGTLTATNLTVDNGGVIKFGLPAPGFNQPVTVTGNLMLNGTLNIADTGGLARGLYTLITYGGTLSGGLGIGESACFASIDTTTPGQFNLNVQSVPKIASPAPGSIVSGKIHVQVNTDNTPSITAVTLVVDGINLTTITDPSVGFDMQTAVFSNGTHTIAARFLADSGVGSSVEAVSQAIQLSFQNDITVEWFDEFQSSVPIQAHLTVPSADWTVTVKSGSGAALKTFTGSTTDGHINVPWYGTDDTGNPVPCDSAYFVTISATAQSGNTFSMAKSSTSLSDLVVYREAPWGTLSTLLARQKFADSGDQLAAVALLSNIQTYIGRAAANTDVYLGSPMEVGTTGDWSCLLEYLSLPDRQVTQFYWYGHSGCHTNMCIIV